MKRVAGLLLGVTIVLLVPSLASAQTGVTITLSASSGTITFGEHVRLSGSSAGAPTGSTVQIRNVAEERISSLSSGVCASWRPGLRSTESRLRAR